MAETVILFDGRFLYSKFMDDLSRVMDHSYDIDEIFMLYPEWVRQKERFVDEFCSQLFPPVDQLTEDDFIALRNAMINLYCGIDRMTPGLDPRNVTHVAYDIDEAALAVSIK